MKLLLLPICILAVIECGSSQAWGAEPVTVVFQNGLNGYDGTFDRKIGPGGEADGLTITGQTSYSIDGGDVVLNDGVYTQGLLRFSGVESAIPAGAKIVNARITVVTKTHSNAQSGDSFTVYRLTTPFDSTSSVTTPEFGADGIAGNVDWILGSFKGPNVASQASVVSADVTRAVQSWVDGSPNYGVGIASDRGVNAWSFHSTGATATLRPKLEVTYILDPNTTVNDFQQGLNGYVDCSDIILNGTGATTTKAGITIVGRAVAEGFLDGLNPPTTEPDIPGMIRFGNIDSQIAGRKIESAKLKIVTGFSNSAADSPGPFTVHRLLVPFDETSQYTSFAGDSGAMLAAGQITPAIATFTDMQDCEVMDVDVSEAVKSWAAGQPNYGFYIGSGSPNGWQIFTTGAPEKDASKRPLLRVVSSPVLPVEIASPSASSRHVLGTPFTFDANVAVAASKVEFFLNGVSIGVDTSAPYSVSYPADKLGKFVLTAVLTDANSATITSEPVAFSVVPPAGVGGLYFDGISDSIGLGDAPELKLSTFTVETWFRRETAGISTTTGTGGVIAIPLVAKGRNQADNSSLDTNWFVGIRESDGVLCADFEGAGGVNVPVAGTTRIPYGQWQHAAVTFNGTEWRLYLNGNLETVLNANGLTPRADSIQHASIATAMNSSGLGEGAFGGFMDEVRIWSVARSQAEIRQAINSEVPTAANLVARWSMGEGTGTKITSTATAATVGNFSGAPIWTAGQTFSNNGNPSISFVSPANGGSYLNTSPLQITVAASDTDGTVERVEYFDNGVSIGVSTVAPFSFTYNNPPVGTRRFSAVVTDNGGAISRTESILTAYVTFPSPTVPGYTAGVINGGDAELFSGTPAASPAPWQVVSSSTPPLAFTDPGNVSGDIVAKVNGTALAFNAGVMLAANTVLNNNLAAIDNIVAPYETGGFYHVSSMDNNGPGEVEPTLTPESSSFSLGWFPYAQGWVGANVKSDGTILGGSSSLPAAVVITRTAIGTYQIAGLPSSGNMLALAIGNAADNVVAVTKTGDNWIVTVRDNNQGLEDGDFGILYVPSTANRVISGLVGSAGDFTALNDEAVVSSVTSRLVAQGYELTFGDGTLINPSNTALFITADPTAGNGAENIYSYSANGNSFMVFSHDLPGLNGDFQTGGFRFLAAPLNPVTPVANEVNLNVSDARAAEDGTDHQLSFTVTRRGSTAAPLTVSYTVGGSATAGSDYTALPGTVTIPAGAASAEIIVSVLPDSVLEPVETVTISLAPGSGYTPGLFSSGSGQISDAQANIATTTVSFQEGVGGYTGQFQKLVGYSISAGTYSATLGTAVTAYGIDGGDPDINDLIRFDNIIGSGAGRIPAGAKVLKAELILTTATSSNAQSNGPFIVDRLIAPVDASSTYASISFGVGFEGVRGISTGYPVAGFPPLAIGEAGAADVTDIVRAWAAGEANDGFGVYAGGTSDGWSYYTVGNADPALRPKLVVTYTTDTTHEYTYAADRSARMNSAPNSGTIDGATLDAEFIDSAFNNSQEAFLRFPVVFNDTAAGAIPLGEQIVKAELLVTTTNSFFSNSVQSIGPVTVHQILQDWTTATNFGLYGTRVGTQIADSTTTMIGLGQNSTTWVDVTSIVRNWRAGAPNYGIDLKPSTDEWMFFWPGTALGADVAPRLRITTSTGSAPVESAFDAWAASFGVAGIAIDSDDDHDGISAIIEYALGFSPTAKNSLPGIVRDGNNISMSFTKGAEAAADSKVHYRIMSSSDLSQWTEETLAVQNSASISLTQPATGGKKFFRLLIDYTR